MFILQSVRWFGSSLLQRFTCGVCSNRFFVQPPRFWDVFSTEAVVLNWSKDITLILYDEDNIIARHMDNLLIGNVRITSIETRAIHVSGAVEVLLHAVRKQFKV